MIGTETAPEQHRSASEGNLINAGSRASSRYPWDDEDEMEDEYDEAKDEEQYGEIGNTVDPLA